MFHWPELSHRDTAYSKEGTKASCGQETKEMFLANNLAVSSATMKMQNSASMMTKSSWCFQAVLLSSFLQAQKRLPGHLLQADLGRSESRAVRWVWAGSFLSITVQGGHTRILQISKFGKNQEDVLKTWAGYRRLRLMWRLKG